MICKDQLENIYSKYSIAIHSEYLKNNKHTKANIEKILKEFKNKLTELYPTQNEFKDNFAKLEYRQSSKHIAFIKYILQKLNYGDNTEQVFDHVTLEHILPQTPDAEWKISKDEILNYVNKIGNIIPLGLEYNQKASNFVLSRKVEMYEESQIKMTKDLVSQLKNSSLRWSEREINQRTIKLAEDAWDIWGI